MQAALLGGLAAAPLPRAAAPFRPAAPASSGRQLRLLVRPTAPRNTQHAEVQGKAIVMLLMLPPGV